MKNFLLLFSTILFSCNNNSSIDNKATVDNITIRQVDTAVKYRTSEIIKTINFKHNSSTINSKDTELLKYLADICSSDSLSYVKIFAYTDTIGTEKQNDKLSENRAMTVQYLLGLSKFSNSVYVQWLGESAETYDLHFDSAHAQQNCADIWIVTSKKINDRGNR